MNRLRYALANVLGGAAVVLFVLDPLRPVWHVLVPTALSLAVLFAPRVWNRR